MTLLSDLFNLLFPRLCPVCQTNLAQSEKVICLKCLYDMPRTAYHKKINNPIEEMFIGRTKIDFATAHFFFNAGSPYTNLIHHIKYKGNKMLGYELGRIVGYDLRDSSLTMPDVIIPVPLHKKRQRERGYNQAKVIAEGLSAVTNIPINEDCLVRIHYSKTQTNKSKYQRWSNVHDIFALSSMHNLENKHLLLVDDVITTGSTLEACAIQLEKIPGVRISISTLGVAPSR